LPFRRDGEPRGGDVAAPRDKSGDEFVAGNRNEYDIHRQPVPAETLVY
jgi:hypothetical protein